MSDIGKANSPAPASSDGLGEEITERILAAAQQEFELIGIRRSSMSDVAQRAGIARATVYRRFPGKDSLVQAVASREMLAVLARVVSTMAVADNGADTVVQLTVATARELRTNPLLNRLLDTEPEELYRYAAGSGGTMLATGRTFISQYLHSLHDDRMLTEPQVAMAAEIMIRLAAAQLLIPDGLIPFHSDEEMAMFARQYFVPMITATATQAATK
ncbi:TetR/AcrR family transcriptional regulator [Mycobacteroides salmoniphilum]|uniref:TetR/AcrR family transcriptional regulator n=1 Tax=Mycobacteroides salmoniphilum TaxID=404941 RepID=UPI001065512E|nr:TetR/AcrR family transcriptional regulator [Mycobacteroides salmoniphilum]TDZ99329.1 Bacterial regulatory protein, tetR family [Mycobacteroides salmoniphilum]